MALVASRITMGFEFVRNLAGFAPNPVDYELTPGEAFQKGDLVVFNNGKVTKATASTTGQVLGVMAETITASLDDITYGKVYDNPFNVYRVTFADHRDATATGGSTTTLVDTTLPTSADDVWNGALLYVYEGPGAGSIRTVADYTGATDTLTVTKPFPEAITSASKYILLGAAAVVGDVINVGKAGIVLKDSRTVDANASVLSGGNEVGPLACVAIYPKDLMMDVIIRKHLFT